MPYFFQNTVPLRSQFPEDTKPALRTPPARELSKGWGQLPFPLTEVTTVTTQGFVKQFILMCTQFLTLILGGFFREGPLPSPLPTATACQGYVHVQVGAGAEGLVTGGGGGVSSPVWERSDVESVVHLQRSPLVYISYAAGTKFRHTAQVRECLTTLYCSRGSSCGSLGLSSLYREHFHWGSDATSVLGQPRNTLVTVYRGREKENTVN